jgi:hypothetical protein
VAASLALSLPAIPLSTTTFAPTCSVGMTDHDAYISVLGPTASNDCQTIVDQSRGAAETAARMPYYDTEVCAVTDNNGNIVKVFDSGGQIIGTQACQTLRHGSLPVLQPL